MTDIETNLTEPSAGSVLATALDSLIDRSMSEVDVLTRLEQRLDDAPLSEAELRRDLRNLAIAIQEGLAILVGVQAALDTPEATALRSTTSPTNSEAIVAAVQRWTERWRRGAFLVALDLKIISSLVDRLSANLDGKAPNAETPALLELVRQTIRSAAVKVEQHRPPGFLTETTIQR